MSCVLCTTPELWGDWRPRVAAARNLARHDLRPFPPVSKSEAVRRICKSGTSERRNAGVVHRCDRAGLVFRARRRTPPHLRRPSPREHRHTKMRPSRTATTPTASILSVVVVFLTRLFGSHRAGSSSHQEIAPSCRGSRLVRRSTSTSSNRWKLATSAPNPTPITCLCHG
jgi:hypothetical protein